jgi:hypothetical protein
VYVNCGGILGKQKESNTLACGHLLDDQGIHKFECFHGHVRSIGVSRGGLTWRLVALTEIQACHDAENMKKRIRAR